MVSTLLNIFETSRVDNLVSKLTDHNNFWINNASEDSKYFILKIENTKL